MIWSLGSMWRILDFRTTRTVMSSVEVTSNTGIDWEDVWYINIEGLRRIFMDVGDNLGYQFSDEK